MTAHTNKTDTTDQVDSPKIAALGVLSALGVFISVMALQVVFFWQDDASRSASVARPPSIVSSRPSTAIA